MKPNLLTEYLEDSIRRVSAVRGILRRVTLDGGSTSEVETARVQIAPIFTFAAGLGRDDLADLARAVDLRLASFQIDGADPRYLNEALEHLSILDTALLKASIDDDILALDLNDLLLEPLGQDPVSPENNETFAFDASEWATPEQDTRIPSLSAFDDPEPTSFETPGEDEFEIDPELLEIFGEEAAGLLENIESSLANLAADPNDSDSLWEIRRNAHTFKGSAGIVGLKQLSEVAHRVEDLLDRMAETKCGANARIVSLLHTSTECLRSLTNGDMSAELVRSISQLYYDFDGVLASLHELPSATAPAVQPRLLPAETQRPEVAAGEIDPGIAERLFAAPRSSHPGVRSAPGKSVVRVSLERLDDLVRIVRDMLISRSVFEQNLKSMERQIDDLHNATRRLQATSSKLEIDFEASLMGTGATFLAKGPGTASGSPGGFDELELDQYTEFHESTRDLAETTNDAFSINTSLDLLRGGFESVLDEQRRLVDDLQHRLMQIRMVEFGALTNRMQRAVRVTCEEENKKAEIRITNESLAIDTQILDSLIEPLVHLLKNSVVHGIELPEARRLLGKPEAGIINVSVENDETHIVLTVSDDGNGISAEAIKEKAVAIGHFTYEDAAKLSNEDALELIFLPGLTTAEKLNLSAGRGVGMSIVKESIAAARGSIFIESTYQQGTTFTIRMPLALAVTKVLLAKVGGRSYALPLKQITYVTELRDELFSGIDGKKVEILGKKLPLLQLSAFLGNEPVPAAALLGKTALLYESAERSCALAVENVDRAEEVVIKPLTYPLDRINGLLGAAILGNGDLVPILDMPALLKKRIDRQVVQQPAPSITKDPAVTVLIVDDSPSVRHMTSKVIQAAGWNPKTAKDGLDALEQLKALEELPAIILSDIEMPRMDGYEFAASLQRSDRFSSIPVIMITSRTADKHREKALENGVSQYLTKPYEDCELIDSIKILANLT